jgi:hydrogenase/urease accessory protein HupE
MKPVGFLALFLCLLGATGMACAHALQPGFLQIEALDRTHWRIAWRVPDVGGQPMPLALSLPEGCDRPTPPPLRFDGLAHVAAWPVTCPSGLAGGTIRVDGLEATQTDVLVRFELTPGAVGTLRLTPTEIAAELPERPSPGTVFTSYTRMGIDHILSGTDHLLFVFALMLLVPDGRRLFGAITAFTAAHSLSLAAAALGWIVVPPPPVEAVIALSIMFLAAELARPSGQPPSLLVNRPWIASFGFGLLHGLGFAGALKEIGLPEGEVPLALFAFNIGVEIGQLMFVATILVSWFALRRILPGAAAILAGGTRVGLRTLGYAIGTISAFWFLTRLAAF